MPSDDEVPVARRAERRVRPFQARVAGRCQPGRTGPNVVDSADVKALCPLAGPAGGTFTDEVDVVEGRGARTTTVRTVRVEPGPDCGECGAPAQLLVIEVLPTLGACDPVPVPVLRCSSLLCATNLRA